MIKFDVYNYSGYSYIGMTELLGVPSNGDTFVFGTTVYVVHHIEWRQNGEYPRIFLLQ